MSISPLSQSPSINANKEHFCNILTPRLFLVQIRDTKNIWHNRFGELHVEKPGVGVCDRILFQILSHNVKI